jgi:arsenate reductase
MAEGIANALSGGKIKAYSAGSNPAGFVHPKAIEVMKEIGIDISSYTSKPIDDELLSQMDYVITLCGDARDSCPIIPSHIKVLHWGLIDPAKAEGTEEEVLNVFRKIRDEIKEKISELIGDKR